MVVVLQQYDFGYLILGRPFSNAEFEQIRPFVSYMREVELDDMDYFAHPSGWYVVDLKGVVETLPGMRLKIDGYEWDFDISFEENLTKKQEQEKKKKEEHQKRAARHSRVQTRERKQRESMEKECWELWQALPGITPTDREDLRTVETLSWKTVRSIILEFDLKSNYNHRYEWKVLTLEGQEYWLYVADRSMYDWINRDWKTTIPLDLIKKLTIERKEEERKRLEEHERKEMEKMRKMQEENIRREKERQEREERIKQKRIEFQHALRPTELARLENMTMPQLKVAYPSIWKSKYKKAELIEQILHHLQEEYARRE